MPENNRSTSFAADVIWTVAVVVAATVVIGGTKFVARRIRNFKKS